MLLRKLWEQGNFGDERAQKLHKPKRTAGVREREMLMDFFFFGEVGGGGNKVYYGSN